MLRLQIVVLCLVAISGLNMVSADFIDDCLPGNQTDPGKDIIPGVNTICFELRTLRAVIPHATLVSITVRHYQRDPRFRHSMIFLQTAEFVELSEQLEDSAVFQQLLTQLENAGVNTADIASVSSILDCLLLPSTPQYLLSRSASPIESRSMQSYAMDLMRAIPRQQFQRVLAESIANNSQFAIFYRMVRSPGFQSEVLRALGSRELAPIMAVLRRNYIDLRQLTSIAFRILSWGPRPY